MGGKSYYCDYCECFMKDDINVRYSHNCGTAHSIAKANYLQQFKEPEQILEEEHTKTPCKRIASNLECSFGFFCRFSHYSVNELDNLQWIVDMNRCKRDTANTPRLPWKKRKYLPQPTPPSLQPIDFDQLSDECFNNQWG